MLPSTIRSDCNELNVLNLIYFGVFICNHVFEPFENQSKALTFSISHLLPSLPACCCEAAYFSFANYSLVNYELNNAEAPEHFAFSMSEY